MQDRPEAPELLDAVAAYLFAVLRPLAPRGERFRLLVAANVCAVVAREIRAGGEHQRADLELFRDLLGERVEAEPSLDPDPAADVRAAAERLAGELRSGRFDDRLGEVLDGLRGHVRRKLEIARPGYAASQGDEGEG
jgi:hypothetical protein